MSTVKNDFKEVIRQNYDSLFLRFLIYTIVSSFILFYLLFLRISDPSPLTLWNKIFYSLIPLVVLLIITIILFIHISFIHGNNSSIINATEIKALKADEFTIVHKWKNGSGLGFNKITAYIVFQHYRFFIHFLPGDENVPDRIMIQTTIRKTNNENYWLPSVQNYALTFYQSDWDKMSHEEIITHFTELAERLRKNNVPPEN